MIRKQVRLNDQTVLFLTIQFNANICLLTVCQTFLFGTLSGAAISNQSGTGINGNEVVLNILLISKFGTSTSDGWVSYAGHLLVAGIKLLQKGSRFILQHQPTGLL